MEIVRKVCMLGDPAVGKTSLVRRFVLNMFDDKYISTIGTKVVKKKLVLGEDTLILMIWDVLGQRTHAFHTTYYKGAKGALIVSDLTRPQTIEHLRSWHSRFKDAAPESHCILVGNKLDLGGSTEMLVSTANELDVDYYFTSAKTGEGVERVFRAVGKKIMGGG